MSDMLPVVCPGCGAYWRITRHLDAVGADGHLRRPLGPLTQAALADVFTSIVRVRSLAPGQVADRVDDVHRAVYGLIERVEADTLAAVGGLAAIEQAKAAS